MDPAREEKLAQLDVLLHSRTLNGSENLKAFLRFVVEKSLNDEQPSLKEYVIASEVFGQTKYDPRIDSMVRVQAGRLRSKLQEYYATEGKSDRVVINLPKGHYAPTFSYLDAGDDCALSPAQEPIADHILPADLPPAENGSPPPRESVPANVPSLVAPALAPTIERYSYQRLLVACLIIASVLFAGAAIYYRAEAVRVRDARRAAVNDSETNRDVALLWNGFLRSPQPILITYSNTLFERRPDSTLSYVRPMSAGTTGNETQTPPRAPAAGNEAARSASNSIIDYYTGVGEVMGVSALTDFFSKSDRPFRVKRSLLLNWDDVKTENVVILGSAVENLFLRKLPQKQNFTFRANKELDVIEVVNADPRPGEAATLRPKFERLRDEDPASVSITEDYALVSLLDGLGEENKLMILAGITTHGTHAAAEYVTKPEYVRELVARLNTSTDAQAPRLPASFEVLLKVKVNDGVPVQISYVTHHVPR